MQQSALAPLPIVQNRSLSHMCPSARQGGDTSRRSRKLEGQERTTPDSDAGFASRVKIKLRVPEPREHIEQSAHLVRRGVAVGLPVPTPLLPRLLGESDGPTIAENWKRLWDYVQLH